MNHSNNPLQLNVGYLYNKPIGTSREIPIELDSFEIDDLLLRDLQSQVRISRTREGLLFQMAGNSKLETNCVRCLEGFYLTVNIEFEELYQFPSRLREETDLVLSEDGYIDLGPLYREYLILAIPIKPLCKPDCKGLCAFCGTNLNKTTCEHSADLTTPPGFSKDET